MSETTLYRRLGGRDAIAAVVDEFYDRVLADDRLRPFFEDVDMAAQRAHQTQFLAAVTGGPVDYDGAEMDRAHAHLDIDHEDYDAIETHLDDALGEFEVPKEDRAAVVDAVEAYRSDIVSNDG
ncbi:group I truncated hemoglobin [Halogeometricum limi]|uniref:Hemoglobin n=1 Tax=Halogeometricum limi TaxID=555875 RepID=A0A1I6GR83_9EURY|nr:group 1 truncated hemoglobin [Halogeometricum limi]SFR44690.1 hemoglobin [Halogeometricum limi]